MYTSKCRHLKFDITSKQLKSILDHSKPCHEILCSQSSSAIDAAGVQVSSAEDRHYLNAKPFHEIPGPKGLPFLGTLLEYRKGPFQKFNIDRFQDAIRSRYEEYGDIMKETIAGATVVHLFNPDYIRTVFQTEGKIPHIAPLLETTQRYRKEKGMSPGLGNTNGEEWYRLRSAVQQMMMRPKEVTVYLPQVESVANKFIKRMKKIKDSTGQIPNFKNEISKWNLESSTMTVFEKSLGCLDDNPDPHLQKMIDSNNNIFTYSTKLKFSVPWYKLFNTPTWKKLVQSEDYFFGNGQKLVDETVAKISELKDKDQLKDGDYNFLTYLLSRENLSYKDVSIITLSLFGDGLNTTVPTFVSILYCLAKNPEVQQKVYEEICDTFQGSETVTPEMLNKLTYTKAFVKEAFRFFPIGLDVARVPQKNIVIGGYQVPAGTHVELNNFVMFQSTKYFIEPSKFLPERWLRGGSAHNIHPYILTPFGHGPRMCAGRRFAEQEMYVLLSKILQNFKLEWHAPDMDQRFQMLMTPDRPATFTFIDRHK